MLTLLFLLAQSAAPPNTPSALIQAIERPTSSAAQALIDAGADPNSRDAHGRTPLHAAVTAGVAGKPELVRLLLEKGADPNLRDDSGASPLDEAVWKGSYDSTLLLLNAGASTNEPETKTGATPVNEAAFQGHLDLLELLVAHGGSIDSKDRAGFSPAQNAIRRHHPEVLRYLLSIDDTRSRATALLAEAVRRGQTEAAELLLDAGAQIDARSESGSTALYDAALKGDDEMVSLLVSRGASVNIREFASGTTPLYAAAAFGRAQVVSTLLLWGGDPNLLTNEGKSALSAAQFNNFIAVAKLLKAAGAR